MATKNYEKEVKDLARKKSNKNCFNCGKSGPQNNVVLDFNTFVCTSCAGLHRGFSHRVRSINMSNWTKPELDALSHGGNRRAKRVWLASYTPEAYVIQAEDEKNVQRFMNLVYDKKQWYDPNGASKKEKKHKKKPEEDDSDNDGEEHSDNHGHISSTPSHKSSSSDASPHPAPSSSAHNNSHAPAASTPSSHNSATHSSHNNNNNHSHATPSTPNAHSNEKKGSADVMDLLTSLDFSEPTPIHNQPIAESSFEASFDNGSSAAATAPPSASMQQAITAITNSLKAVQSNFNLSPQQLKQCVDAALSSFGASPSSTPASNSAPSLPSPHTATSPPTTAGATARPGINKVQAMLASAQPTPPPMTGAIALPGFGASPAFGASMPPASSGNPFDDDFADDGGAAAAQQQQQNYYAAQQAQLRQQQAYPQQYGQQTYVQQGYQQPQYGVQPGMVALGVQPNVVPAGYYVPQQPQQIPQQQQARPKTEDLFSFANPLPR